MIVKNRDRLAAALLALALAACQPKAVRGPAPVSQPLPTTETTGVIRYRIDGAVSELHILVFRGGPMARMGHNHVVSSNALTGTLLLHEELSRSQVELTLPVDSLIVDDPPARAVHGEEFSAAVPAEARAGTRRNLLRAEVLDAERFPTITMRSIAIRGTRQQPELTLRITIKQVERDIIVPVTVREHNQRLVASGEFTLKQTDFGITPFSVAFGALQVEDQLRIKFSIVAVQEQ